MADDWTSGGVRAALRSCGSGPRWGHYQPGRETSPCACPCEAALCSGLTLRASAAQTARAEGLSIFPPKPSWVSTFIKDNTDELLEN